MSKSKSQARLLLVDDAKESVQVNAVWKAQLEVSSIPSDTRATDLARLDLLDTYQCTVQQLLAAVTEPPLNLSGEIDDCRVELTSSESGTAGQKKKKKKKKRKDKQRRPPGDDAACGGPCHPQGREQQSRVETYHRTIQQFVALYGQTLENTKDPNLSFDQHSIALEALQQAAEQGALSLDTFQQFQALRQRHSDAKDETSVATLSDDPAEPAQSPPGPFATLSLSLDPTAATTFVTTITNLASKPPGSPSHPPAGAATETEAAPATEVAPTTPATPAGRPRTGPAQVANPSAAPAARPPQKVGKYVPKTTPPSGKASLNNGTNSNGAVTKKDAMSPLGSLFAHLLDWRTFTNWPTDAKAALYSLLPYVEDGPHFTKMDDVKFKTAFTEARGVDLLYGILLCNTYDKARDQSVARLLMKILLCLKHVYPEIQDEIECIAFNTTAVTAAVHCLSKDFDDETAELGLAALRELKKHSVSECDPIEEEVSDDSDVTTDEDLEEAYVEDQEDTRPVIKQRRRTISHKTPRAICKAINVSLISDIIETIATAGTKDEVILSKRYHYLQLVLALPLDYISGDLAEQLLFLHEKGDTTTHQKAIKELVFFSVLQLNEGRDGFINAASYCYKDHGRIALEEHEILALSHSLICLHKQRKLSLWWGSALVVARCLQDNTRTRDRRDLATCFLSLVGDPALEENSDSPLFVLGELLANEMSNASRSLHSILMKLGLLEVLSRCLKEAKDCYTVQNCVYCVEHLQCSASRLLETEVVGLISESTECKRTGCDGECEKIAGRTLLQLLLMSGISEVELMVRRNYTDPFILGIANRSEECLKKFFVMPPSLITKIFTTYPADARDQFLTDVAALTKHKNTKIASIASSMYPTLVQFRNADTKSWLSKCLKSKLAFDTQEYKLKTKSALVKSSATTTNANAKRQLKNGSLQGVPNDTIHLMASGDYDGALLLCASCVDGSKARKADAYAWMVNGIAHVMRALASSELPSCPHTMKKAATMLNLAKARANGGGQWLSVIHTFLAIAHAFMSSIDQSFKVDQITLVYEHVGHIALVLGVYGTGHTSYSKWLALDPTSEFAKEGLNKTLSLKSKLTGQRSNRNKVSSRREDPEWANQDRALQSSQHDVEDELEGEEGYDDSMEGTDEMDSAQKEETDSMKLHQEMQLHAEQEEPLDDESLDQAEQEERRLRDLLLKMKNAQEELKRKNDEVEKLVNEVQGHVQGKVDSKQRQKEEKNRQREESLNKAGASVDDVEETKQKSKKEQEKTKKQEQKQEEERKAQKKKKEEEKKRKEEEDRKLREEEDKKRKEEEKKRKEEEERRKEEKRRQKEEEDKRRKEEEKRRKEEEKERKQKEEEEKRRKEEEKRLKKEAEKRQKQEQMERKKREAERKQKEEEERRKKEEERKQEERKKREEEEERRRKEAEEKKKKNEERRRKEEEERKLKEEEERKRKEEEQRQKAEEKKRKQEEKKRQKEEKQREEEERKQKEEERIQKSEEHRRQQEHAERKRKEEEDLQKRRLAEWPTCAESMQAKSTESEEAEKGRKKRKKELRQEASQDAASPTPKADPASPGPAATPTSASSCSPAAKPALAPTKAAAAAAPCPPATSAPARSLPASPSPSGPPSGTAWSNAVAPAKAAAPLQQSTAATKPAAPAPSVREDPARRRPAPQSAPAPPPAPQPAANPPALPPASIGAPAGLQGAWAMAPSAFSSSSSSSTQGWASSSSSSSSSSVYSASFSSPASSMPTALAPSAFSATVASPLAGYCVWPAEPGLSEEEMLDAGGKKPQERKRTKQQQHQKRRGSTDDSRLLEDEGAASKSPEEMDGGRRSPQNPLGSAVDDIFKRIPSNNNSDDVSAMDALLSGCTAATRSSQGSNSSTENPIWPKLAANLFTPGIFVDPASNVWQPNSGDSLQSEDDAQATTLRNLLAMVSPPSAESSVQPMSAPSSSSSLLGSGVEVLPMPLAPSSNQWGSPSAACGSSTSGNCSSSTFSSCKVNEAWSAVHDTRVFGSGSAQASAAHLSPPPVNPTSKKSSSTVSNCTANPHKHQHKSTESSSGRTSSTRSRSSSGGGSISSTCSNGNGSGACRNRNCACAAASSSGIPAASPVASSSAPSSISSTAVPGAAVSTGTSKAVAAPPPHATNAIVQHGSTGSPDPGSYQNVAAPSRKDPSIASRDSLPGSPAWNPPAESSSSEAYSPSNSWYPNPMEPPNPGLQYGPNAGAGEYMVEPGKGMPDHMYGPPMDGGMDPMFHGGYYGGSMEEMMMHTAAKPPAHQLHMGYAHMYHNGKVHAYPGLYHVPHGSPYPHHHHRMHMPVTGATQSIPVMFEAMQ